MVMRFNVKGSPGNENALHYNGALLYSAFLRVFALHR